MKARDLLAARARLFYEAVTLAAELTLTPDDVRDSITTQLLTAALDAGMDPEVAFDTFVAGFSAGYTAHVAYESSRGE